jgi:SWI/SNF-related matrix-associated actin-dependent regulator of chromatin subfamily A member 5
VCRLHTKKIARLTVSTIVNISFSFSYFFFFIAVSYFLFFIAVSYLFFLIALSIGIGFDLTSTITGPQKLRGSQALSQSSSSSQGSSQTTSTRDLRQKSDLAAKSEVESEQNDAREEEMHIEYSNVNGRSLRKRKPNNSLKAQENGWSPEKSRRSVADKVTADVGFDLSELNFTPIVSRRSEIRREIANETTGRRNSFLVDKKDFWLPLLPENNYISKLIEKYKQLSKDERAKLPTVQPYEELAKQPKGVKATMKPYQLSGLSFMLYLHRNGLSGILGDEMGLGKTLQTLSLIQHLKENDPKTGTGRLQRPFLIVCPLSVLSSWMTEAKKWTPGLKAIRFHGPIKERTRLKQIVVGEIDMQGNMTAQAKAKRRGRRKTTRKETILLDTDSEDEEDVGVDLVVTTYE